MPYGEIAGKNRVSREVFVVLSDGRGLRLESSQRFNPEIGKKIFYADVHHIDGVPYARVWWIPKEGEDAEQIYITEGRDKFDSNVQKWREECRGIDYRIRQSLEQEGLEGVQNIVYFEPNQDGDRKQHFVVVARGKTEAIDTATFEVVENGRGYTYDDAFGTNGLAGVSAYTYLSGPEKLRSRRRGKILFVAVDSLVEKDSPDFATISHTTLEKCVEASRLNPTR